jgi:allophanate hydrolase
VTDLPAAPTIAALHERYAGGLDPGHVVAETYRRIAAAGDPGIFISLLPEAEALAATRALGPFDSQRKPLWGVPFAIKDNIDLAGLPTTAGCPAYAYRPVASAAAVARLIAAGAIPVGKTNLDQFATGLVGLRTPYPPPRNPFDPQIVPGGSSSGSAVAVSRGLVTFALGTDTAGSGRVPAALNNIIGLKPTRGAASTRGVVPACRTLDCVSVFALTIADAVAVNRAMAGFDPDDPFSRIVAPPPEPAACRIGVPALSSQWFGQDPLAERAFRTATEDLARFGMVLDEVDLAPFLEAGKLLYGGPWVAERYHAVGDFLTAHPEAADPVVRRIILAASSMSASDAFAGQYHLAELRRRTEKVWRSVDALVVPTIPRPPCLDEVAADPIGANNELGTFTGFANLLDLCVLAVPGRFRDDGFPSGVMLLAPAGCDSRLVTIGSALCAETAPFGYHLHETLCPPG